MVREGLIGGIAAICLLVQAPGASAQTPAAPASPVQPQPRDPNMPALQNTVPEKIDGAAPATNLSDKLEKSGGVITPPGNVDPGIRVSPPVSNPGTMPVIPPPGSPGGNPNVQPK